ncbi:MAG: glutamine synthetase, partial [Alphaproteobacteria bacterium]|nr:glutamine synthetase [Alphaproteobacteria bacterium]
AIDPQGSGNGVHIHFSLNDTQGRPLTYDPARPGRVSALAGSFVAGVLAHLPALVALTCPCDVSYLRLVPQHWSAAYIAFGANNREAGIRICPTVDLKGFDPAPQLHLEYRAADAAASPHLALGAVVRAGLEGIRAKLEAPPLIDRDPAELDEAARARLGIRRLPSSLELALRALEVDDVVRGWLHPELLSCYLQLKRFEMAMLAGLSDGVKCRRYQRVY